MATPQKWLITGGAGYIGSHIADYFLENGKDVIVYDSLHSGVESRVSQLSLKYKTEVPLIIADVRDEYKLGQALRENQPYGIVHTAALKSVSDSFLKSEEYKAVNFEATKSILELCGRAEIKNFIFSSTAAVYGSPESNNLVKEQDLKKPISPYGHFKLLAEREVEKFLRVSGNNGTSLRFFNVIGRSTPQFGDTSRDNLVPIVLELLKDNKEPTIFGTNYDTPDGTCVRDFIDVRDLARAHLEVANTKVELPFAMNVGTGFGTSVREMIDLIFEITGKSHLKPLETGPREGDPGLLCADVSLIKKKIGFITKYTVKQSIQSLV